MLLRKLARAGCAAAALASTALAAAPASRAASEAPPGQSEAAWRFGALDVFELELAADPQIAPDGRHIVYVRRSMDIMKDRALSNLWWIDVDGGHHRPLVSGLDNASSPRWSPDGTRIAYLSNADRKTQLYVRWVDTGQTALVTHLTEAPASISWSPDGRWIAFTMPVKVEARPLAKPPARPEGAEWAKPVKLIDRVRYRADGAGFLEAAYRHVFVVPSDGGTPRQLTRGDFNHQGPLSWTADGRRIVFAANRQEDWEYDPVDSEVWTVDVDSGELTQLTDRDGPDRYPVLSPDGKQIAYLGFDDALRSHQNTLLYVMGRDGSNPRALTADLDRAVRQPVWSADGRRIYCLVDDHGITRIAAVTLEGKVEMLDVQVGGTTLGRPYSSGSFSVARNHTIAYTRVRADRPADVAVVRRGGSPRQLTSLNEDLLGHKELGAVRTITWASSFDGRTIEGWVVTPPRFDPKRQYPLILEIHGGPFANYGPRFSAEIQRYAAEGYVVLYANPRGSTSYGQEFFDLIHHHYPGEDYDDLMSGVDAVLAEGYVDADNLFVTGGSGGGVLSAWIVGKTDRFRAAVVAKPVINWTSFALTSDAYPFFARYWFGTMPWEDPQAYWQRSPLALVGNVKTPTMLLTGEADYRTPISETEQFYQALQLRKVDTAMVRVPDASHGITRRPSHLIAKVDNVLAWFEKYRTDARSASRRD